MRHMLVKRTDTYMYFTDNHTAKVGKDLCQSIAHSCVRWKGKSTLNVFEEPIDRPRFPYLKLSA